MSVSVNEQRSRRRARRWLLALELLVASTAAAGGIYGLMR